MKKGNAKTPNGGVRSVAYFFDDGGNQVPKDLATHVRIVELDEDGNRVNEVYLIKA